MPKSKVSKRIVCDDSEDMSESCVENLVIPVVRGPAVKQIKKQPTTTSKIPESRMLALTSTKTQSTKVLTKTTTKRTSSKTQLRCVKPKCQFTDNGEKCKKNAVTKSDNKYCAQHYKIINHPKVDAYGNPIYYCKGRTQCDELKPGIKKVMVGWKEGDLVKCDVCLEKERNKDQANRDVIVELNKIAIESGSNFVYCNICKKRKKKKNMAIRKDRGHVGEMSPKCIRCFVKQQIIEKKRKRDLKKRRLYSKNYEANPEVKARRKIWRQLNRHLIYRYYTGYRAKLLSENPIEYRKRCAANQKAWRKANPEYMERMRQLRKTNVKYAYSYYISRANRCGYDFDITFEQFKNFTRQPCNYCNQQQKGRLTGIDRLNNDVGYEENNIVPCCKTCNMMKNTYNESTFILMCAYISTKNYFTTDKNKILSNKVFNNYVSGTYSSYKNGAKRRGITDFTITQRQFNNIKNNPCYLCKRPCTSKHRNGIDRFDNNIGYTLENCKPCCGDCNYLKKNLDCWDFLFKCSCIAVHNKDRFVDLQENFKPSKFCEFNKNKDRDPDSIQKKRNDTNSARDARTRASKTPEAIAQHSDKIKKYDKIRLKTNNSFNKQ